MNVETGAPLVLQSLENGILTLTMNRPKQRNALSRPLMAAMQAALDDAHETESAAVLLRAPGGASWERAAVKGKGCLKTVLRRGALDPTAPPCSGRANGANGFGSLATQARNKSVHVRWPTPAMVSHRGRRSPHSLSSFFLH